MDPSRICKMITNWISINELVERIFNIYDYATSERETSDGSHQRIQDRWIEKTGEAMQLHFWYLKEEAADPKLILAGILECTIYHDYKYSMEGRNRKPTSDPKKLNTPRLDPNFSFFVHYILRGGRCPEPAFAGAFDEIRNHFPVVLSFSKERIFSESDLKNKLQTIFAAYNAAPHHQQKITQAELDRTGWGLRLEK